MIAEGGKPTIDHDFALKVWENKEKVGVYLNDNEDKIYLKFDTKYYEPKYIFDCLFHGAAQHATVDKNGIDVPPSESLKIFHELRGNIAAKIDYINYICSVKKIEKYDYSSLIEKLEIYVSWSNDLLQVELLKNQISTNDNTRNTNKSIKTILIITTAIYLLQLLVSLGWIPAKNSDVKSHIQPQDSSLKTVEIINFQLQNQNNKYLKEIDSLSSILNSRKEK